MKNVSAAGQTLLLAQHLMEHSAGSAALWTKFGQKNACIEFDHP